MRTIVKSVNIEANSEDWLGNEVTSWEGSDDYIRNEFYKYTK
jgi:hypothetical protein